MELALLYLFVNPSRLLRDFLPGFKRGHSWAQSHFLHPRKLHRQQGKIQEIYWETIAPGKVIELG